MKLYDLHKKPESLHKYAEADLKVPAYFWDKYKNDPAEMKKRESEIAKDAKYSFFYARDILKGRFEPGELAIAKGGGPWFLEYISNLRSNGITRMEKIEPEIAKDAAKSYIYSVLLLKGPFKKGEEAVLTSPGISTLYAIDVLKHRWPEAEPIIKTNKGNRQDYERKFGVKL